MLYSKHRHPRTTGTRVGGINNWSPWFVLQSGRPVFWTWDASARSRVDWVLRQWPLGSFAEAHCLNCGRGMGMAELRTLLVDAKPVRCKQEFCLNKPKARWVNFNFVEGFFFIWVRVWGQNLYVEADNTLLYIQTVSGLRDYGYHIQVIKPDIVSDLLSSSSPTSFRWSWDWFVLNHLGFSVKVFRNDFSHIYPIYNRRIFWSC